MELAAKTRQEASKSCFKEALEAPWRRLGGALGGPRGSQEGKNRCLEACFFKVEKTSVYEVVLEGVWAQFGTPLEKQKLAFRLRGVQKIDFLASCMLTSSLDWFEMHFGGQVGAKLGPS